MASQKSNLSQRRGRSKFFTVICLVIALIACIGVRAVGYFHQSKLEQSKKPQLALNTWMKDLMAFQKASGRFPNDLIELDTKIWRKDKPDKPSRLTHGKHDYVYLNYHYKYFANGNVASVWAIPLGEYKSEFNTVFLVMTADKYEIWRGASLKPEEVKAIPAVATPSPELLATLGMFKQKTNDTDDGKAKKKSTFVFSKENK